MSHKNAIRGRVEDNEKKCKCTHLRRPDLKRRLRAEQMGSGSYSRQGVTHRLHMHLIKAMSQCPLGAHTLAERWKRGKGLANNDCPLLLLATIIVAGNIYSL